MGHFRKTHLGWIVSSEKAMLKASLPVPEVVSSRGRRVISDATRSGEVLLEWDVSLEEGHGRDDTM